MTQSNFLRRLIEVLNKAGIPSMLAGSLSSMHYGELRSTNDVDVVIDPTTEQFNRFLNDLGDEYYVAEATARDALQRRSMFNVVDLATGWKADLVIRKNRPFSVAEFSRRQPAKVLGVELSIAMPEDVILSKLEWAKMSNSERQIRDAAGVIAVHGNALDLEYLLRWADDLGVADTLQQLLRGSD